MLRETAEEVMSFEHETPLNATAYLEKYKSFGVHNRAVAIRALMAGWDDLKYEVQLLRGGKVLAEYGAAIEELFAFAYATHRQCTADVANEHEHDSGFLEVLFNYSSRDVHIFIRAHDFGAEFQSLYCLPEPHVMGNTLGLDPEIILQIWGEIGGTIEDVKRDFYTDGLKDIYNKLKHPFLVLSPSMDPEQRQYILPVATKSQHPNHLATVYPAKVDFKTLSNYLTNTAHIRDAILGLVKVMEYSLQHQMGTKDADSPRDEQ